VCAAAPASRVVLASVAAASPQNHAATVTSHTVKQMAPWPPKSGSR
jgi:hypothetical protein